MRKPRVLTLLIVCIILVSGCNSGSTMTSNKPLPKEDNAKEITIEVFDVLGFYQEAALRFETLTGVKVNVINHYSAEKDIDDQDYAYLDRIPGELMVGKGADIYSNIKLDFSTIGKQGYLCNLADWISADPDFSDEKYYMNILRAGFDRGDVYSVPLFLAFRALGSDVEIPELEGKNLSWEEFFDLTKGINRNGVLLGLSDSEIFMQRLNDRYSSFIDEKNKTQKLDSPEVIHLLEQSKAWSEQGICIPSNADKGVSDNAFIKDYNSGIEVLTNVRFVGFPSGINPYFYDIPSDSGKNDKANKVFTTDHICINAASPNKVTAWRFIKFLLSKEIQLNQYNTPINREAAADYIKKSLTESLGSSGQNDKAEQVIKETETILNVVSDTTNKHNTLTGIEKILLDESKRFFSNEISAEEAAKNMADGVTLYFKEQ